MADVVPVGYRFLPTDEELLVHYLGNKIAGRPLPSRAVADADVYGAEPSVLLRGDREAYFFATRKRKNATGSRVDRSAGCGSWTLYGKEEVLTSVVAGREVVVGWKSSLSFNDGNRKNSGWTMHEYELVAASGEFQTQVLCHLSCTSKAQTQQLGLPMKRKRGALPCPAPKKACPDTAAVTTGHQEHIFPPPASNLLRTETDYNADGIDSAEKVIQSAASPSLPIEIMAMKVCHQEPFFSPPAGSSLRADADFSSNCIDSAEQVVPPSLPTKIMAMKVYHQEPFFSPPASSSLNAETDESSSWTDSSVQEAFLLPVSSPTGWKSEESPSLAIDIMASQRDSIFCLSAETYLGTEHLLWMEPDDFELFTSEAFFSEETLSLLH